MDEQLVTLRWLSIFAPSKAVWGGHALDGIRMYMWEQWSHAFLAVEDKDTHQEFAFLGDLKHPIWREYEH